MTYVLVLRDGTCRKGLSLEEVRHILIYEHGYSVDYAERLLRNVAKDSPARADRLLAAVVAKLTEDE